MNIRETPVRHPDDLRAQAPGPDWTGDHNEPPRVAADIEADWSPGMPRSVGLPGRGQSWSSPRQRQWRCGPAGSGLAK